MTITADGLYESLPAIYRTRDAEKGGPLLAILAVLAEQMAVVEDSLLQAYDDRFIETCQPWLAAYIGDLIGYRALDHAGSGSSRAEVANTIAYRRRKGTLIAIEQVAADATGWPARAVEFFKLCATNQHVEYPRLETSHAPNLRQWEALEHLNTAFETTPRTVEIRSIETQGGRYNICNIGIFLWRLRAYPLILSPATRLADGRRCFFSPLGNSVALFSKPVREYERSSHREAPLDVPMPISRNALDHYKREYYGESKSLFVRVDGSVVSVNEIDVCDLSDAEDDQWANQPEGKFGIDPELGRISLPEGLGAANEVLVGFHYGLSADLGGGQYERRTSFEPQLTPTHNVSSVDSIQEVLGSLRDGGVAQIVDNGRHVGPLTIEVKASNTLELRASNGQRPTIDLNGEMEISGEHESAVALNGLLITGGAVRVPANGKHLRRLLLRHCTLVPGHSLTAAGDPMHPDRPSLIIEATNVSVEIDHCIVGGLQVAEGANVVITNSIVDATSESLVAYASPGHEAAGQATAGGELTIVDCTVVGKVHTRFLRLASNCIFLAAIAGEDDSWRGPLQSNIRQRGCVRFCHVPPGSRVPRQYRCQPAFAVQRAYTEAPRLRGDVADSEEIRSRLKPEFTSLRYGDSGYAQLACSCPREIRTGAEDESEMGVFRGLHQPQREANLRTRLSECVRLGLDAGFFFSS